MSTFKYTGDDGRTWANRRFKPDGEDQTVMPGDVVEADVNPDPIRFVEVTDEVGVPVEPPVVAETPTEFSVDEPAQEG